MKHRAALRDRIGFEAGLDGAGLDAADKLQALLLPEVEVAVALVVAVHDPGLAGRQELGDQGAFIAFAVGQTDFSGDAPVDVKAQMNLGLFGGARSNRPRSWNRRRR